MRDVGFLVWGRDLQVVGFAILEAGGLGFGVLRYGGGKSRFLGLEGFEVWGLQGFNLGAQASYFRESGCSPTHVCPVFAWVSKVLACLEGQGTT